MQPRKGSSFMATMFPTSTNSWISAYFLSYSNSIIRISTSTPVTLLKKICIQLIGEILNRRKELLVLPYLRILGYMPAGHSNAITIQVGLLIKLDRKLS